MEDFITTITESKLVNALVVVLISLIVQKIAKFIINKLFSYTVESSLYYKRRKDQERRAKTLISVTSTIVTLSIWTIAVIVIMGIYGLDISTILVSAGFMGAALAFGAQASIRDFVNGFFMIMENQYRIDDYVEFDSIKGQVEDISIRSTSIRDDEGKLHHVPNGSIVVATNLSMGRLRENLQIEVSRNFGYTRLKNKVDQISNKIIEDPDFSLTIKEGPIIKSLDNVSKDKISVTLTYATTAAKRKQALTIINNLILDEKIQLA